MKINTFTISGYKVKLYKDSISFYKDFDPELLEVFSVDLLKRYDVKGKRDKSPKCLGYAVIENKTIGILVLRWCTYKNLAETVGHEIGHIFKPKKYKLKHTKDDDVWFSIPDERKAMNYERFTSIVLNITNAIIKKCPKGWVIN